VQNPQDPDPDVLARFLEHVVETTELLEAVVEDRGLLAHIDTPLRKRLLTAAGKMARPAKEDRRRLARTHRRREKVLKRDEERALLNQTQIRKLRENPIFLTPKRVLEHGGGVAQIPGPTCETVEASTPIGTVDNPRTCYVCRKKYSDIHFFYDQMCVTCGDVNFGKRTQVGDLRGRVALVTGARVKIGYQAAIFLLRSGCHVIAATRFPRDAARRYAAEEDFEDWAHRLEIHGIDLRHIPSVEAMCDRICATHDRMDFILNNACQTVRRPPGFYDHLMDAELNTTAQLTDREEALVHELPDVPRPGGSALPAAALSQIPLVPGDDERGEALFPTGSFDADQQQVDLRMVNSWRLKLAEVPTVELLEVHLVNAIAPFVINGRLKALMANTPGRDKHIVNVSAMEGQFYRTFKSDRHPHTNMAKASLNMMTRTAAMDYIHDGIHMNSVDTGWVTDEDPAHHAEIKRDMHDFHPPLDIVDGAARIVDPFFSGLATGEHVWGQFLRNYEITDW
jgi:NAD(P)-dependent dehydrogenase (short-subunit alcohol dehydrogenase family)